MIIRGQRVLTTRGLSPASVHVRDGRIIRIAPFDDVPAGAPVTEAGTHVVMPGLVDTHVHVNEPGRTEWEGFGTATRAAAAGGVTTLFDMPLNSIPATTTVAALHAKRAAARGSMVNVAFTGGVVPGNAGQLEPLHHEGVRLFKCFMVPSGVEEFPCVTERDLREALPVLARLDAPLMVHAELPEHIVPLPHGDPRAYTTYLASRPDIAETDAVRMVLRLAREFDARVHIVHLSSGESLAPIREARRSGVRVTCETCPHYLCFSARDIPDGRTEFKCAPPIRDRAHQDALWAGLVDGTVDMVVSDHSPCPPALKGDGDFFQAWGGIASLQLGLSAVWTEGRRRGVSVEQIAGWMSRAPAHLGGLGDHKGQLAEGYDADIIVWDPDAEFVVDGAALFHRHPVTPYHGAVLTGCVRSTYVGGIEIDAGQPTRMVRC